MDTNQYIGIPYADHGRTLEGMDCYGLVRYVYQQALGIELPDISDGYSSTKEHARIQNCVNDHEGARWCYDVLHKEELQEYDVLVFRMAGLLRHVGLCTNVKGHMLHLLENSDSCIEKYTAHKWNNRLVRAYRHVKFR